MKRGTNIELGLEIVDVCKAKIHTLREERGLGKSLVCFQGGTPEVIKIGAAFQNCLQLLIGVETMNNGQKHETSLNDTEGKKQGHTVRHRKRSKKSDNKDHRMKKMKVLLKDLMLQFSTKRWG